MKKPVSNTWNKKLGQNLLIFLFSILLIPGLSSCSKRTPELTITPTPTSAFTRTPTPRWPGDNPVPTFTSTPTLPPVGQPGNPVTMGFVYKDKVRQEPAVRTFLQSLADETGLVIEVLEFDTHFDLLAAMDAGRVSFTWMLPLTYIYAQQNEIASVAFVTRSYNLTAYGTQFLARSESGYQSYYDPDLAENQADEYTALQQFSETRPCFLDEYSLAGYVVPWGYLQMTGITTQDPVFMRSSTGVIRGIRAGGICEFGATYAIMGDPRTSSELLEEYPGLLNEVTVIWRSEAIIPNLTLVYNNLLDPQVANTLSAAIEKFGSQPDGPQVLSASTSFLIEGLEQAGDEIFDPLREVVIASGVNLVDYLGY